MKEVPGKYPFTKPLYFMFVVACVSVVRPTAVGF
jgi:hypothetical protein